MKYTDHYSKTQTPQSEAIPGREADMAPNNAGGVTFKLDDMGRFERFLVLGSEGGTYYTSERGLTRDNAATADRLFKTAETGIAAVNKIVEISVGGRAPKNSPAIFALALACASPDEAVRQAAFKALPKVARIGTHLFEFLEYVKHFRGWGRGLRNAVTNWYGTHHNLELQVVKYRQRNNWTHRDVVRQAHPEFGGINDPLVDWFVHGTHPPADAHLNLVEGYEKIQRAESAKEAAALIQEHRLPREAVPTDFLKSREVWEAMLPDMPLTAMLRNLGNMSKVGLLTPMSDAANAVVSKLDNDTALEKARIHPLNILMAQSTYAKGHGMRGSGTWDPVSGVVDALEDTFYRSFKTVEPTGQRFYLGLDCSSSMTWDNIAGSPLTPRDGAAVMAMVTARAEKHYEIRGFSDRMVELGITATQNLDTVKRKMNEADWGGTDCSLPMLDALAKGIPVDTFVCYTDNETWYGQEQPVQALNRYRKVTGIPAKLIVVAMTATEFSIADPLDAGMLDIVGFDSAAPQLIANFARG